MYSFVRKFPQRAADRTLKLSNTWKDLSQYMHLSSKNNLKLSQDITNQIVLESRSSEPLSLNSVYKLHFAERLSTELLCKAGSPVRAHVNFFAEEVLH